MKKPSQLRLGSFFTTQTYITQTLADKVWNSDCDNSCSLLIGTTQNCL